MALDESSDVVSQTSGDDEYDDKVFFENRQEELLKWTFKSELDRKLILGILARDVELEAEWDADTIAPDRQKSNRGKEIGKELDDEILGRKTSGTVHRDSVTRREKKIFEKAMKHITQDDSQNDTNTGLQNDQQDGK